MDKLEPKVMTTYEMAKDCGLFYRGLVEQRRIDHQDILDSCMAGFVASGKQFNAGDVADAVECAIGRGIIRY